MRIGASSTALLFLSFPISWMLFYHLGRTTINVTTTTTTTTAAILLTSTNVGKANAIANATTAKTTEIVLDDVVDRLLAARRPLRRHDENENAREDDVVIAMRRIRILNDCSSNPDCLSSFSRDVRGSADDDEGSPPLLPMPFLITAYFAGQGIGRLIDHTTHACLNAASVGRGCLVDTTSRHNRILAGDDGGRMHNRPNRDTWYTFRSFVRIVLDADVDDMARRYDEHENENENERDDDASHRVFDPPLLLSRETAFEARYAISLLPNFANGHWTMDDLGVVVGNGGGVDDDIATTAPYSFERVLPLGDANVTGGKDVIRLILDNPNKLVLSPNWGTSWFAKKDVIWPPLLPSSSSSSSPSSSRLTRSRLESYMQNYIYRPTPLLRGLYDEYSRIVLGRRDPPMNDAENNDSNEDVSDVDDNPHHYGAVHLRLFFLKQSRGDDYDGTLRDFVTNLHDCMRRWQVVEGVDRWWVITDDLVGGGNITRQLREEAARWEGGGVERNETAGSKRRKMEVFADDDDRGTYDDDDDRDDDADETSGSAPGDVAARALMLRILKNRHVVGSGGHSNSEVARGPLGHEAMANSLVDWMVLHESRIAIIMDGSFGSSGARGNGKFLDGSPVVDAVGVVEGGTSASCHKLRVYRR